MSGASFGIERAVTPPTSQKGVALIDGAATAYECLGQSAGSISPARQVLSKNDCIGL